MKRLSIIVALLAASFAMSASADGFDAAKFCSSNSCTTTQVDGDPAGDHIDYVAVCPQHAPATSRDDRWMCTPQQGGRFQIVPALRKGNELMFAGEDSIAARRSEHVVSDDNGGAPYLRSYAQPQISDRDRACMVHPASDCGQ